jgi:hypothetical protein
MWEMLGIYGMGEGNRRETRERDTGEGHGRGTPERCVSTSVVLAISRRSRRHGCAAGRDGLSRVATSPEFLSRVLLRSFSPV